MNSQLAELAAAIVRHAPREGDNPTPIEGFSLLRANTPTSIQRGVMVPSVCLIAQGTKISHAGDEPLRYRAGDFLATSIDMPIAGQVLTATRAKPFVVARFDLRPGDVLDVLAETGVKVAPSATTPAIFVGTADAPLVDVVLRAVRSLDDLPTARFLAPLIRRELVYRLITGPSANAVCQSVLVAKADDGVGRAAAWIRAHYREPLDIEALAKHARMSTSSLQHKFKAAVMMPPLQYQKRLRLDEARRLLVGGLADATTAALQVGYASTSQFTREYRRTFGLPPLQDRARTLRGLAGP